jgi:MIP family channel proteins
MEENVLRRGVAEFIGTFTLIFIGGGAGIVSGQDIVAVALANGLAIGIMVTNLGHISGGHFNPAVTLSMLVTGRISIGEAVRYWVAQLAGATAAALMLLAIFPSAVTDAANLGVPAVGGAGISTGNALVAEIVTTFFLVFVIYGVAVDKRGAFSILAGLPIGLTISIGVLAVGAVSGAAFNPARWFGPALVGNHFTDAWAYILGPIVGGLLAAAVYKFIIEPSSGPVQEMADTVAPRGPAPPAGEAPPLRQSSGPGPGGPPPSSPPGGIAGS